MKLCIRWLMVLIVALLATAVWAEDGTADATQVDAPAVQEETAPPAVTPVCHDQSAEAMALFSDSILAKPGGGGGGGQCGSAVCGEGEFCCNASCSICAPFGWACTQEICF